MLDIFSIWFAKSLGWLLRATGRHGATLPGLIIERLHPRFLDSMLSKLPEGVVVVSGTNGKTTTTKIITELLGAQNKKVLTNKTGGNFVRGIFATVAQSASLSGHLDFDVAVIELDEAYAVHFVHLHSPRAALLLNITRDQLDRFGEIDTTAKLLQQVADKTKSLLVLNDDDNRITSIKSGGSDVVYFGIAEAIASQFPNDEELYAAKSSSRSRHSRMVELTKVGDNNAVYKINDHKYDVKLQIDGQHNALNAAAALALLFGLYPLLDPKTLISALSNVKPAFGRGEVIDYRGSKIILQLIKNPSSFRQALHVLDIHKPTSLAIVINDNYADGRDVSWLWDIDFKILAKLGKPVFVSGIRAYDMAVRLKYDGVKTQSINRNIASFLDRFEEELLPGETALVYTTYSAMLAIRKDLGRRTKVAKV